MTLQKIYLPCAQRINSKDIFSFRGAKKNMGNSQSYSHSSNSNNKTSSDNNGDNNVWEEHRELKQVTLTRRSILGSDCIDSYFDALSAL